MENVLFKTNPLYENNFVYNELQQKTLIASWLDLYSRGILLRDSYQYGFRTFSQTNEDGILLYIFTIIGTTNKKIVEIGINCNNSSTNIPESIATNLISFHGWQGLIVDGDKSNTGQALHHFHLNRASSYYFFNAQKEQVNTGSSLFSPVIRNLFITPNNINTILTNDGFDYHVIDSINVCQPRVLIIETDGGKIDYNTSVTVKKNLFDTQAVEFDNYNKRIIEYMVAGFSGTMSLAAAVNLARKKGYRLVTLSSGGWNAFFIRNDIGLNDFPDI